MNSEFVVLALHTNRAQKYKKYFVYANLFLICMEIGVFLWLKTKDFENEDKKSLHRMQVE